MDSHDHIISRSADGPRGWFISQYGDGPFLFPCAPTTLLMALADFGLADANENTRAKLIVETGFQKVSIFQRGVYQMSFEAKARGLQAQVFDNRTLFAVDSSLRRGSRCIVFGSLSVLSKPPEGHIVYVRGKDAQGRYAVGDPLSVSPTVWNKNQLWAFMNYGSHRPGFVAVWL